MVRRIAIAAVVFGASCAGGDLATTSFGGGDNDTDLFATGDDAAPDDTTEDSGPADSTGASGHDTTSTTGLETGGGSSSGESGESCVEEICDGLDNDCDDEVDEGCSCVEGDMQSCYSGAPETIGVGPCVEGAQTCGSDGTWGPCEGAVEPSDDVCNDVDDDCDGDIDEDFTDETCGEGICQVTVDTCENGTPVECVPLLPDPSESCNGVDDDCDGDIDEGCDCTDGDVQNCYSGPMGTQGVGLCQGGTHTCAGGAWGACQGDVVPTGEACDGADNDCDMATDENNPGGGGACNTGQAGVCAIGHQQCGSGALGCVADSTGGAEICDGLDNDCDTGVDEGNPGGGGACNTGLQGVCATGTNQCQGGAVQCVQNVAMSLEVCDAVDNDCDGSVNEGNPGGGLACNTGLSGVCSAGTTSCSGTAIVCNQNVASSPEICDGFDNDCDTGVDEGNPGAGAFCNTGLLGQCANGTTSCSGGAIACSAPAPAAEVCANGLDEDCDGTPDDGCGCTHGLCVQGVSLVSGCSACATTICATDAFCCTTAWDGQCVGEVASLCGSNACSGACAHSFCDVGGALANGCDAAAANCVAQVCAADAFCCNLGWDAQCVGEVATFCGILC
ncbi:MAG TPA: MopE-related protein [Nannocystaceae bacterium]|nr:MopE-related protein [Nannocystaceae bacterium]